MDHHPRRTRNLLWIHLPLQLGASLILWGWVGIESFRLVAVGWACAIVCLILVELFVRPPDVIFCMHTTGPECWVPKGTRFEFEDSCLVFVTLRAVGNRWYTRLWCRLLRRPLPTQFLVPVRKIDNRHSSAY